VLTDACELFWGRASELYCVGDCCIMSRSSVSEESWRFGFERRRVFRLRACVCVCVCVCVCERREISNGIRVQQNELSIVSLYVCKKKRSECLQAVRREAQFRSS
jgi:hypothetical protein